MLNVCRLPWSTADCYATDGQQGAAHNVIPHQEKLPTCQTGGFLNPWLTKSPVVAHSETQVTLRRAEVWSIDESAGLPGREVTRSRGADLEGLLLSRRFAQSCELWSHFDVAILTRENQNSVLCSDFPKIKIIHRLRSCFFCITASTHGRHLSCNIR